MVFGISVLDPLLFVGLLLLVAALPTVARRFE
jgi:hypothetical protein